MTTRLIEYIEALLHMKNLTPPVPHLPRELLAKAVERIRELEQLVYVPGLWRCAKCECQVMSTNLHAASGRISANNEPQACPNNCGPMWRVTERDAGNRLIDQADREQERVRPFVQGAYHALRSYEFGNASTDLAKATADGLRLAFPYVGATPKGEPRS